MGDLHATDKQPTNRTDDYWETLQNKIKWIVDLYHKKKCDLLLQPGDFFDSCRASNVVIKTMISLLQEMEIATIYGQHDMRYHNPDVSNTPLAILEAAGTVEILGEDPFVFSKEAVPDGDSLVSENDSRIIWIYGAGWGEDIPTDINKEGTRVLVTHRMIIKDKLWEGQEDFTHVQDMFKYGYDLMVTGDNHQRFSYSNGEQHLINAGSLMRSNIGQVDHEPFVYIYDTETKKVKGYQLPIALADTVFDMENAKREKKKKEINDLFVKSLKGKTEIKGLNFLDNLDNVVSSSELSAEAIEMVQGSVEGIYKTNKDGR